jgi:hypothetical protein
MFSALSIAIAFHPAPLEPPYRTPDREKVLKTTYLPRKEAWLARMESVIRKEFSSVARFLEKDEEGVLLPLKVRKQNQSQCSSKARE